MNYQRIHDAIIESASNRTLLGYREKHHVIPRCMGGVDTANNLVELTARENIRRATRQKTKNSYMPTLW